MQFQDSVGAGGGKEFGSYEGTVWYVEASLDGALVCLGPVLITSGGECQVDLQQDADNFYLNTSGACQNN